MMVGEGLDGVRKMNIMEPRGQALYLFANTLLVHQSIQFIGGEPDPTSPPVAPSFAN
jgi:hypothetical protein